MPPSGRQRDYAQEYRDRIRREQERAAQEGRPFSRSRARGHSNPEQENTRRRVKTLWKNNKAMFGPQYPGWDVVKATASNYSWSDVERVLKDQQKSVEAYRMHNPIEGRVRYDGGKVTVYPIEFFWYHGNV
jgi:hypothetical protein